MWELKICVTYTGIKKLNEAPGDTPTHHQMSMQIEINWWNTWNPPQRMQVIEEPYWWIQIYWHRCCYTKATAPLQHFPRNDALWYCTFFTTPPQNQPSAVCFPQIQDPRNCFLNHCWPLLHVRLWAFQISVQKTDARYSHPNGLVENRAETV